MTLSERTQLGALIEDAVLAIAAATPGPEDKLDHEIIVQQIDQAGPFMPPRYQHTIQAPLHETFNRIGAAGWADVLRRDTRGSGLSLLGLDLTQSLVQCTSGAFGTATHAMQEVVSDLYDGFLSAADRGNVKPPDHGVVPPLVKWGRPKLGPYAWPVTAAAAYGCGAGIVNMPPAFTEGGLAAWAALPHETAHQILHADEGLHEALAAAVIDHFERNGQGLFETDDKRTALAHYWARRIDETAADLMGVVNMGPAAAVGLIAYFRALAVLHRGEARLSLVGPASAVHPAGIARGYLAAYGLGLCSFAEAGKWEALLIEDVNQDVVGKIYLAGEEFSQNDVQTSARLAAEAILTRKVDALEESRLIDIQDWRPRDQQITQSLILHHILGLAEMPPEAHHTVYAAHVVAAAVMAAFLTGQTRHAQQRMIKTAAAMHSTNPSWSALATAHAGDLIAHVFDPDFAFAGGGPAKLGDYVPIGYGGDPVPIGFGGDDVPLFFGGDWVPWFLSGAGSARTASGDKFEWRLKRVGLRFDPNAQTWELAEAVSINAAVVDRRLDVETLNVLLGAPAWVS